MAVTDSAIAIEAVKSGEYDIGFCGIFPEEQELETVKIAEDEIVLIVFPGHPFAGRKRVSFLEVCPEPLIFREPTFRTALFFSLSISNITPTEFVSLTDA